MIGKVTKIKLDKGFGFIMGEDNKEYFFHMSGLKSCSINDLAFGTNVTFNPTMGNKGHRAEDIYEC